MMYPFFYNKEIPKSVERNSDLQITSAIDTLKRITFHRRAMPTDPTLAQSVVLAHLSDLHMTEHADPSAKDACHSTEHLIDLTRHADVLRQCDRVIVSGDLSDRGNPDGLLRAREFLTNHYSIGNGQTIGLHLNFPQLAVIPGNHDAFNTTWNGNIFKRWQTSLENFDTAFPEYERELGCSYDWIDRGEWGVYIAYADTCFLGDPEFEEETELLSLFDQVAKGKLDRRQAKKLLKWSDLGRCGKLHIPNSTELISAEKFIQSFKILVMHHYVFEPAGAKRDRLMELRERHDAFRNVALADFDVLLCGHKHVPEFSVHTYGHHLNRRGSYRYLLNQFRRTVGLGSLPMQLMGKKGQHFTQTLSWAIEVIFTQLIRKSTATDDLDIELRALVGVLQNGLEKPAKFQALVTDLLGKYPWKSTERVMSDREIKHIGNTLYKSLSKDERQKLAELCKTFDKFILQLKKRPFVQIMAGSSCKKAHRSDRPRGFSIHTVERPGSYFRLTSKHHRWNAQTKKFEDIEGFHKDFVI